MKNRIIILACVLLLPGLWGCGGGGGDEVCGDEGETACPLPDETTVTLSGQVAVRASDAAGLSLQETQEGLKASSILVRPKFATIGDTVLADAEVALVKVQADGTETESSTTTTDASGNYSLPDVPVCQTGAGTASDYYYEIRVVSGDMTVVAPACPSAAVGDETVNVSPESNLAAKIISDVADVPGTDDNPVPSAAVFREVRELTAGNVADIADSITIPALSDAEGAVDMANGVASAGGDAEKSYKKFQFESEFVLMTAGADIGAEEGSSYLARIAKEGCESSSAALPQAAAEAMADALTSGTTFTPEEIVDAVNAANDGADVTVDSKVAEYANELAAIEEAGNPAALVMKLEEALGDDANLGAFYTKRDLAASEFSSTTELQADQAVSFLETFATGQNCSFGNTSMTRIVAALTGSSSLGAPAIDNAVVYNDSGFGCNGAGEGHFRAQVDVYLPVGDARTINSVVMTSTDGTALGGDGSVTLNQDGPSTRYVAQQDGDCVAIDQEVTYTITATLSDSSTVTDTVVRTHPQTMESVISMNGAPMTNGGLSVTTDMRPLISWTAPADIMAAYAVTPPTGSQVKYTYEISYYQLNGAQPDSNADTALNMAGCQMPGNSSSLYATNSIIPIADCDVAACATAAGTTADKIYCRVNIQTYLFDPYDQQQSQAAGAFRQFCVDTSAVADGDCGG